MLHSSLDFHQFKKFNKTHSKIYLLEIKEFHISPIQDRKFQDPNPITIKPKNYKAFFLKSEIYTYPMHAMIRKIQAAIDPKRKRFPTINIDSRNV